MHEKNAGEVTSRKPALSPALARLLLLCCAALWGGSFLFTKIALGTISPQWLMCIRMFGAAACMLVLFWRQIVPQLKPAIIVPTIVVGATYWAAMNLQTIGLQTVDPGRSAFLTAVYCVLTPFAAWAIARVRPRAIHLAAALICLAGVGFVSLKEGGALSLSLGDALTLLAAVNVAINITLLGRFTRTFGGIAMTWVEFTFAGVLFLVGALLTEPGPSAAWLQPNVLCCLCYLVFLASMTAQVLQNISLPHVSASQATIIMCSESLFAVALGAIFWGEQLGWNSFVGFALILTAMWLSSVRK